MSEAEPTGTQTPDDEQIVLESLDAVRAVADPLRLRMLFEMTYMPRTVKELAALLDVPQTRLYYHVKLLERQGLIWVVERRLVSGIEERTYRSSPAGFTISPTLMGEAVDQGLLKAAFDLAQAELGVALASSTAEPGEPDSNVPILTFNRMWLSPDEIEPMIRELGAVIQKYAATTEPSEGDVEYNGVFAVYLHPNSARADHAP